MKIKLNFILLLAATVVLSVSCQQKKKANENLAPNVHMVIAQEVIQSSGYTYLRVTDEGKDLWIAITRQEAEKGKTYYFQPSIEMTDFESKELKRTFPSITFVDKFSDQPILAQPKIIPKDSIKGVQPTIVKTNVKVDRADGGITIAELYGGKDTYSGKTVRIKGQVVKYNSEIMGKNWVHIQDGTESNGLFDITVTTNDSTKVGNVVTFEGTITLKKDFGYGYFYEVLVENGKLLPAK